MEYYCAGKAGRDHDVQEATRAGLENAQRLLHILSQARQHQDLQQHQDCKTAAGAVITKFKKVVSLLSRTGHARFRRGPPPSRVGGSLASAPASLFQGPDFLQLVPVSPPPPPYTAGEYASPPSSSDLPSKPPPPPSRHFGTAQQQQQSSSSGGGSNGVGPEAAAAAAAAAHQRQHHHHQILQHQHLHQHQQQHQHLQQQQQPGQPQPRHFQFQPLHVAQPDLMALKPAFSLDHSLSCTPPMSNSKSFLSSLSMDGSVATNKPLLPPPSVRAAPRQGPSKKKCTGKSDETGGKCGSVGRCHCKRRWVGRSVGYLLCVPWLNE